MTKTLTINNIHNGKTFEIVVYYIPASLARLSTAPERPMFSLPARSTKLSLPVFSSSSPSIEFSLMWMVTEKTEWERLKDWWRKNNRCLKKCLHKSHLQGYLQMRSSPNKFTSTVHICKYWHVSYNYGHPTYNAHLLTVRVDATLHCTSYKCCNYFCGYRSHLQSVI